jgi:formylglycine-generating enzyme required for sulfatase activity
VGILEAIGTIGGIALIVALISMLTNMFQWWEARRQTKIAIISSKLHIAKENNRRMRAALFPRHNNLEKLEDYAAFKDINEPWCPELVVILKGQFLMGSPEGEGGRFDDERPQHIAKLEYRFAMGRYPVTFEQYDHFCIATKRRIPNDEGWGRGQRPVINVSWEDAQAYAVWLSGETKHTYRLPTEAEWEFVCRAGTTTEYSSGDRITVQDANYSKSRIGETSNVGTYPANRWGLYDLHGNVWEWCLDGKREYDDEEIIDPLGPTDAAAYRVTRGGAWSVSVRYLRSAFRHADPPGYRCDDIGFRCARIIK